MNRRPRRSQRRHESAHRLRGRNDVLGDDRRAVVRRRERLRRRVLVVVHVGDVPRRRRRRLMRRRLATDDRFASDGRRNRGGCLHRAPRILRRGRVRVRRAPERGSRRRRRSRRRGRERRPARARHRRRRPRRRGRDPGRERGGDAVRPRARERTASGGRDGGRRAAAQGRAMRGFLLLPLLELLPPVAHGVRARLGRRRMHRRHRKRGRMNLCFSSPGTKIQI